MDQTEVLILRPTFIWGPGVAALDTFVEKVETEQFIWIDKGQVMVEMVHVDNVAEAIVLATVKGRSGEIYFVTDGQARPAKEFLTDLLATRGGSIPDRSLPAWVVKPLQLEEHVGLEPDQGGCLGEFASLASTVCMIKTV